MSGSAESDRTISLSVDATDVVRLLWISGSRITGELATEAMAMVDAVNGDRERPLLVDMRSTATLTRQARQRFACRCTASRIALLGESAVDRVIANFALGVSRSARRSSPTAFRSTGGRGCWRTPTPGSRPSRCAAQACPTPSPASSPSSGLRQVLDVLEAEATLEAQMAVGDASGSCSRTDFNAPVGHTPMQLPQYTQAESGNSTLNSVAMRASKPQPAARSRT